MRVGEVMLKQIKTLSLVVICAVAWLNAMAGSASAAPNPPTGINADQGVSITLPLVVRWTAPAGGDPVSKYYVYRSVDNSWCDDPTSTLVGEVNHPTVQYSDSSVVNGQHYYYRVKSVTAGNVQSSCSPESGEGWLHRLPRPVVDSATQGSYEDRVEVTPIFPVDSFIEHYLLYRSTSAADGCNATTSRTIAKNASLPIIDSVASHGVVPGTHYYYAMQSVGASGAVKSVCSEIKMGYAKIGAPQSVRATDGTYTNKVAVSWQAPALGGNISGYEIYRDLTSVACQTRIVDNNPTAAYDDTNVTPGVLYYYSIKTISPAGLSECSPIDPGYAKIGKPQNVSATDGTYPDKVIVSWQAPSQGGNITGYEIYRDLTSAACQTRIVANNASTTYQDTDVTPGILYYYSIKTISPTGLSECSSIDPGFARIGKPQGVQASDGDFINKVRVTWQAPAGGGAVTGYRVYRNGNCAEPAITVSNLNPAVLTLDDTNVTAEVVYSYSVKALSAASNQCSTPDTGYARAPECSTGKDDDKDGKIDYPNDPGCSSPDDDDEENPSGPECDNGKDDDKDGKIDYPNDPGCSSPEDPDEEDKPVCSNGKDDDGDNKIDYPTDPGCSSPNDSSEEDLPECSNGKDDDNDGTVDYPNDPGCSGPDDDDEHNPNGPDCDNGKDDDADGKIDYPNDPGCSSPEDPDEEDSEEPLQSPAFTKFNTFLGQWNFAELINQGSKDSTVQVTVLNLRGQEMISRAIVVPSNSEVDVDINGLVMFACDVLNSNCEGFEDLSETQGAPNGLGRPDGVVDTYGLVRFDFDDSEPGQRILGRISFYRPNDAEQHSFSFAFAREFRNPSKGRAFAMSNTYDPQGMGYLVPNWAEVINFDDQTQTFTMNIYTQQGALKDTRTFSLPPLGEFDFQAGHEFEDESGNLAEGVFLVEVVPDDNNAEYFLSVSRYSSNAHPGIDPATYNFALCLDGQGGTKKSIFSPISNRIGGVDNVTAGTTVTNWVEVANVGTKSGEVTLLFRGANGGLVASQKLNFKPKSQFHFNASAVLSKNSTGSVEIFADIPVVAQSMSYVHGSKNNLQTGFASPARVTGRSDQVGTINTFLSMQDVLQVYSTTAETIDAGFEITSFSGGSFSGVVGLNNNAVSELEISNNSALNFPPDTYGAISLSTPKAGQALAEVHRIRVVGGEVDFIMPTLVK